MDVKKLTVEQGTPNESSERVNATLGVQWAGAIIRLGTLTFQTEVIRQNSLWLKCFA